MATRNLTSMFVKLRGDRRGVRRPRPTGGSDDRPLIAGDGAADSWEATRASLPPLWVDTVESINDDVDAIKRKIRKLEDKHKQRLLVSFDGSGDDADRDIDLLTQDITRTFKSAEMKLQRISGVDSETSVAERNVRANIQRRIAQSLQQLSTAFRRSQKQYLERVKQQKEGAASMDLLGTGAAEDRTPKDTGFTDDQTMELELMEQNVEEHDQEVQHIARSIEELAGIFKELAALVIDQGTILDRIDYNLECAVERTHEGMEQLVKAEEHQKSARATKCIIFLIVLIAIMSIVLVIKKA